MMHRIAVGFLLLSFALGSAFAANDPPTKTDTAPVIVIRDVTVISPERETPLPHATVVIRDGRIAQVGGDVPANPNAKTIDGHGKFLIPGLIDSHVHVGNQGPLDDDALDKHPELLRAYRTQLPRSYLAFGFTSLVDLDLKPETLDWFNAAPLHPNLCSCGRGVRIVGGYMAQKTPKDAGAARTANIVYEPTQAKTWPSNLDPKDFTPQRVVDRVADAGAICLKTFVEPGFGGAADWPVPGSETLAALRKESSRRGLVFVIHANAVESWSAALNAHADVIAHGLWHWSGDKLNSTPPAEAREVIEAAARAGVGVQPTLQAVFGDLTIFDKSPINDPRLGEALPGTIVSYLKSDEGKKAQQALTDEYRQAIAQQLGPSADPLKVMSIAPERAMATLKMMVSENVKLLFGTDTPSNEGVGNPPGLNGRLELGHWAEAGVPLQKILRAATLDNAETFGFATDRGTIAPGKRADLLLLDKNPLETITAYDAIETVFLNGEPIARFAVLPARTDSGR